MTAGMNMTLCPSDETLAAFIDGRLKGADRQAVIDHLAECAECRDVVLMADQVRVAEGFPAPVPVPDDNVLPFRRDWIAPLTIAASVALVLFLARDPITNLFNGGMTNVVNGYKTGEVREVRTRISGFPYRPAKSATRGGTTEELPQLSGPIELQQEYSDLTEKTGERSWKEYRALAAAALHVGRHTEAAQAIENAARLAPNEPTVLNDLAAIYVVEAGYNAKAYEQRALDAADRAWKVTHTPESAWNRAVAYENAGRDAEAIRAWEDYLKLDSSSEWAEEARKNIEGIRPLL